MDQFGCINVDNTNTTINSPQNDLKKVGIGKIKREKFDFLQNFLFFKQSFRKRLLLRHFFIKSNIVILKYDSKIFSHLKMENKTQLGKLNLLY